MVAGATPWYPAEMRHRRAMRLLVPATAAFLLALVIAPPLGSLAFALLTPVRHCHCPGHMAAPLRGPAIDVCDDDGAATASQPFVAARPLVVRRAAGAATAVAPIAATRAAAPIFEPAVPPPRPA